MAAKLSIWSSDRTSEKYGQNIIQFDPILLWCVETILGFGG